MKINLLDRIVLLELPRTLRAERYFSGEEDFFEGHFPGFPVVAGTILLEAMAQTAGWLLTVLNDFKRLPLPVMVESVKLRRYVGPGDRIETRAEVIRFESQFGRAQVEARNGQHERVAEARITFNLVNPAGVMSETSAAEISLWQKRLFARLYPDTAPGADIFRPPEGG